jgi:hypothetical protein
MCLVARGLNIKGLKFDTTFILELHKSFSDFVNEGREHRADHRPTN